MNDDRRVVLDASAVLAWVLNERGAKTVDQLLPVSVVPTSALVESLYRAAELGHRRTVEELHVDLTTMGVRIEPLLEADADRAATLILDSRRKATGLKPSTLSLGDGLSLATAERLGLPVTGGDQHWATADLSVDFIPFR